MYSPALSLSKDRLWLRKEGRCCPKIIQYGKQDRGAVLPHLRHAKGFLSHSLGVYSERGWRILLYCDWLNIPYFKTLNIQNTAVHGDLLLGVIDKVQQFEHYP